MKDYYIKTKDLSVGYQGKVLIRDINLDIKKGEIVTLIGPNGAGKSTILKSVTRQLKLIGGEVYLDSDEIRKLSYKSMARKVAVMLTERMKPELMTCHDVVATGRYPYTGRLGVLSREDENKVDEALMAVHAQELGIRNFLEISDGQRQRMLQRPPKLRLKNNNRCHHRHIHSSGDQKFDGVHLKNIRQRDEKHQHQKAFQQNPGPGPANPDQKMVNKK